MKRLLLYFFLIVSFIHLNSCAKQNDVSSTGITPAQNLITDGKSAQYALNGLYSKFANYSRDSQEPPEVYWDRIHEAPAAIMAGIMIDVLDESGLDMNSVAPTSPIVLRMWRNFYDVVASANIFINELTKVPEAKFTIKSKNAMLGEARFLRAYANEQLLTYFGEFYKENSAYGIMLRKDVINTGNLYIKRSSVAETYTCILADIDFAMANTLLNNPNYYANQWAAKALKARVLMNRGTENDYVQTIGLTRDIIEHGPYDLEPGLMDLFAIKGLNSKEVILGVVPEPGQIEKDTDYNEFYSALYSSDGPPFLLNRLMEDDPRRKWIVFDDAAGGFLIRKYAGSAHDVGYVFRLTEMYLLQAEALTRSHGDLTEAKRLLKVVMGHAGITDFSQVDDADTRDDLEELIWEETTKNLFCEDGIEWFGLLRMDLDWVKAEIPLITSKNQYILPIPDEEMKKNKSLVQNPGY